MSGVLQWVGRYNQTRDVRSRLSLDPAPVGDLTAQDYAVTGMHYALLKSFAEAEVVSAFDINPIANDVYQHNHCRRPYQVCQLWYITLLSLLWSMFCAQQASKTCCMADHHLSLQSHDLYACANDASHAASKHSFAYSWHDEQSASTQLPR